MARPSEDPTSRPGGVVPTSPDGRRCWRSWSCCSRSRWPSRCGSTSPSAATSATYAPRSPTQREARRRRCRRSSERWNDPAYVKAQARERLHFVMPGRDGVRRPRADEAQAPAVSAERSTRPARSAVVRRPVGVGRGGDRGRGDRWTPTDLAAVSVRSSAGRRAACAASRTAARAACPDVVETAPRLPDGTPFPTLYYLTCPRATGAIGTLEADRADARDDTSGSADDDDLRARYRAAHERLPRRARRDRGRAGDRRHHARAACRTG